MNKKIICTCDTDPSEIKVDISKIPEHVRDNLARSVLKDVIEFLKKQNEQEKLDVEKLGKTTGFL
jgi:hypothetical protein